MLASFYFFGIIYIMEAIKIPISICPHFVKGKPKGHYVLAKRLFQKDAPILLKRQFVGFNGFLFVTIVRPTNWDTAFKIMRYCSTVDDVEVRWLGQASIFPMVGGFKIYLPEHIMMADKLGRIEGVGVFRKYENLGCEIYYLEIPKLTAEVLLGRKELK